MRGRAHQLEEGDGHTGQKNTPAWHLGAGLDSEAELPKGREKREMGGPDLQYKAIGH